MDTLIQKTKQKEPNLSGFVPYTGATTNVDLGLFNLTATNVIETTPTLLKLNQIVPQSVINGQPNFKAGLISDPTGTFDFSTIAGVPAKFGIYNPIPDATGGYNAVTYFTNSDSTNGTIVGGLAFGGNIDGDGDYYGPNQATGLNGYVNVQNKSYTSTIICASLTGQLSEGSFCDGFIGLNVNFLATGAGSTADNATGLKISLNSVDSGIITTAIGLNIDDIVADNAYSIKTGLGLVKFGDDVEMAGSLIGVTDLTLLSTTLGAEKLTNGTFTGNANGWTLGTGWTYNTNLVRKDIAGTGTLTQDLASMVTPVIARETYKLTFTISNNTVGASTIKVMCGGVTLYWDFANNGDYTYTFKALTSTALTFDATSVSRYYIDNISLKRYAGTGNNFFAGNTYVENFISAGYTFQTQAAAEASPTTKMTITSDGRVGMGVSPDAANFLDVLTPAAAAATTAKRFFNGLGGVGGTGTGTNSGVGGGFVATGGVGGTSVATNTGNSVAGSGGFFTLVGGVGGAASRASGSGWIIGGTGGGVQAYTGNGGVGISDGTNDAFGGQGGDFTVQPAATNYGLGGAAITATTGANKGGQGGGVTLVAKRGGEAKLGVTNTGGKGGTFALNAGAGGQATSAVGTTAIGGDAGDYTFTGGVAGGILGGRATGGGTNTGGKGSSLTFTATAGSTATGGTSNTGGAGGTVTFTAGIGGVGATANGANGNIIFNSGATEIARFDNTAGALGNFRLTLDNQKIQLGTAQDFIFTFTGSQGQIQSDAVTATDSLLLRGGTNGVMTAIGATTQLTVTSLLGTYVDAFNMAFGTTTGTKIGTATTQKLGFWNVTPIVQPTTNAYTSDPESSAYTGIDNLQVGSVYAQLSDLNLLRVAYDNLRTSYDNLLAKLKTTGIVA